MADAALHSRWPPVSVRTRVTALAIVACGFVLLLTGSVLVHTHRRLLLDNLNESVRLSGDSLQADIEADRLPAHLGGFGADDTLAQVVDAKGRVVASTRNIEGRLALGPPPNDAGDGVIIRVHHLVSSETADHLLLTRRVEGPHATMVVYVAANTDDVAEGTRLLARSLAITAPILTITLAGLVWLLVGRTLRPVEAIRAEVADIGGGDLHRRVPEPATSDEIADLARTMNAMLDRVERASVAQRRFVADASHELRSPLTRMRTELEVDLAHPETGNLSATHTSVLSEVIGLQRLVDDLLVQARSGSESMAGDHVVLDLDDIVLPVVDRFADQIGTRVGGSVLIDAGAVTGAQVIGDRRQLGRVVTNLIDNAMRHAKSTVRISLDEENGLAVLAITDDGPGVPIAERDRIFERFTRVDEARSATGGGAGLGLAIAREIVERHRGTITVDAAHVGGARFVVRMPLADGSSPTTLDRPPTQPTR